MIVRTRLPAPNDPNNDSYAIRAVQETPFLREPIRKCTLLPGVQEVAIGDTASIPLDQSLRDLKVISEGQFFFSIEGRNVQTDHPRSPNDQVLHQTIFTLLGITLLRGRLFNESDNDNTSASCRD